MDLIFDYEHIFFDRYRLTDEEKKQEAVKVLKAAFKDNIFDEEGCRVEVHALDAEAEVSLMRKLRMLKREFFLTLKEETEAEEEEIVPEKPDVIDIAEKYIREKYTDESLCAMRVCEYCNESRKKLDRGFEERFSKSISGYMRALRVDKAAELIQMGEKMEDIAYLCGFGSLKTMQRAFKSEKGKTPCEYRPARLDSEGTK